MHGMYVRLPGLHCGEDDALVLHPVRWRPVVLVAFQLRQNGQLRRFTRKGMYWQILFLGGWRIEREAEVRGM